MRLRMATFGIALLCGTTAALASPASAITATLVAEVGAAARTLELADDAALAQSRNRGIRAIAQRDRGLQATMLDALDAWAQKLQRTEAAEAAAPTIDHLGPLIYGFNGAFRAEVPGKRLTGTDTDALAHLRALRGADFDAAYLALHETALRHMLDLYTDYIRNGDDTDLRALSVRQRPKVQTAIRQLGRR